MVDTGKSEIDMGTSLSLMVTNWLLTEMPEVWNRHGSWFTIYYSSSYIEDSDRCRCGYPLSEIKNPGLISGGERHRVHVAGVIAYYINHGITVRPV